MKCRNPKKSKKKRKLVFQGYFEKIDYNFNKDNKSLFENELNYKMNGILNRNSRFNHEIITKDFKEYNLKIKKTYNLKDALEIHDEDLSPYFRQENPIKYIIGDYDELFKLVKHKKDNNINMHYHEMISDNKHIKLYMDLDLDRKFNEDLNFVESCVFIVSELVSFISKTLGVYLNKYEDFSYIDCTRDEKFSMHIILHSKLYFNSKKELKLFIYNFIAYLIQCEYDKALDDKYHKRKISSLGLFNSNPKRSDLLLKKTIIDLAVYKKNGSLRILYSKKYTKGGANENKKSLELLTFEKTDSGEIKHIVKNVFSLNDFKKSIIHYIDENTYSLVFVNFKKWNEKYLLDNISKSEVLFNYKYMIYNEDKMNSYKMIIKKYGKERVLLNFLKKKVNENLLDDEKNKMNGKKLDKWKKRKKKKLSDSDGKIVGSETLQDYLKKIAIERYIESIREKHPDVKMKFKITSLRVKLNEYDCYLIPIQSGCIMSLLDNGKFHNDKEINTGVYVVLNLKKKYFIQRCRKNGCEKDNHYWLIGNLRKIEFDTIQSLK